MSQDHIPPTTDEVLEMIYLSLKIERVKASIQRSGSLPADGGGSRPPSSSDSTFEKVMKLIEVEEKIMSEVKDKRLAYLVLQIVRIRLRELPSIWRRIVLYRIRIRNGEVWANDLYSKAVGEDFVQEIVRRVNDRCQENT